MTQFLKRQVRLLYTFLQGTLKLKLLGSCTTSQTLGGFQTHLSNNKTVLSLSLVN
jgi:hypothetical protein